MNYSIPKELLPKLEDLAYYFGGASEAIIAVKPERLLDIVMFNGPVGTISPFKRRNDQSIEESPLHVLNLQAVGYEGGLYRVFNADKRKLYSGVCNLNSKEEWVFGLSKDDRSLLENGAHGEHFYIHFYGSNGPQVCIAWLCKKLPRWVTEEILVRWENTRDAVQGIKRVYNEMYLKIPSGILGYLYIGSMQGNFSSKLTPSQIKSMAISERGDLMEFELDGVEKIEYLRFKTGRWITFWAVENGVEKEVQLQDIQGIGRERFIPSKGGAYYIRGINSGGSWLFSSGKPGSAPVVGTPFEDQFINISASIEVIDA